MQEDIISSLTSFPTNATEAFDVPFKSWTGPKVRVLEDVLSVLIIVKLLIGLPLNLMVVFYSFQTFKYTRDVVPSGSAANKAMRVIVVVIVLGIGSLVSSFNKLFALVAALLGPILQTILPLLMGYKIRRDLGSTKSSCPRRAVHVAMMILATLCITLGTYSSLKAILSDPDAS
mmetsp:Transcript_158034/g.503157  ORF Transcript_158034/g.503157 Transcript_158034/m.503157 type:complete len:174 (-) Transcript_158034:42-563(-)